MCEVSLSTIIIISAPPFPGCGNCTCWSSKSSRHLLCGTPLTVTRHMPDTTFSFTQLHGILVTKPFLLIPHAFWLLKRHQLHQAAYSLYLAQSWWEGLLRAGDSQHSLQDFPLHIPLNFIWQYLWRLLWLEILTCWQFQKPSLSFLESSSL